MKLFYNEQFNIDLGFLNYLHPFDGKKFKKVFNSLSKIDNVSIDTSTSAISMDIINEFVNDLLKMLIVEKKYILRALEVPQIPLIKFGYIDKKILLPMRHGVGCTLAASKMAMTGQNCWNLAGGYHHASPHSSEGFCIYNDIGISYQELLKTGELKPMDKILIIDVDAHHGNGNARTFEDNNHITLLDVYNKDIYPNTWSTRERVNISVPLSSGAQEDEYLSKYETSLTQISGEFKIAYVIAGTDVLGSDPLGGMNLSIDSVVNRELMTFRKLQGEGIHFVFLGGGGYSKESAQAISASIKAILAQL